MYENHRRRHGPNRTGRESSQMTSESRSLVRSVMATVDLELVCAC
jgi:hypothetical protein